LPGRGAAQGGDGKRRIRSTQLPPNALKIGYHDLNRALDNTFMAVEILLQRAEAFGNLGNSLGPPIGLSMRNLVLRDDRHLLAQVVGDLFGDGGLQRVQLLQQTEEQQPRAQGVDLARHTPSVPGR